MGVALPDNVSTYIAENIQANIRQLEGAVKKIKAMHELMDEAITIELAENAIDALRTENPGLNPTPERIMEAVANYFYIPVEQMISQNRSKDVAYPRQMAMYMIRQELEYSFPDIAKIFKRDHTTVMHACNKIEEERKNSRETEDVIKSCTTTSAGNRIFHNSLWIAQPKPCGKKCDPRRLWTTKKQSTACCVRHFPREISLYTVFPQFPQPLLRR